jgi:hypothetical protein
MSDQQSNGSKLSAVSAVIIIVAFFLPWASSCNVEVSGYDIATNRLGNVEQPWVYWATLLAGILCLALYFFAKPTNRSGRIKAARRRLAAGVLGFLPVLNIWLNAKQKGAIVEILYGGWIMALGYLGLFISSFIDFRGPSDKDG